MTVHLAGLTLQNPLVLASGVLGTSATLLARMGQAGAGAVTAKSCGLLPRAGHPNPVMVAWEHGLLNAIGLTNPGVLDEVGMLREAKLALKSIGVRVFASIFAGTLEEFAEVADVVVNAEPDLIEINISCPNVHDEFGTPFAADPDNAAAVTTIVKNLVGKIPVSVKLAPNVPNIGRIAAAVAGAGADVITAINTMPGMVVDPLAAAPVLHNKTGGISGPALKPVALRCVAEIARAVDLPIIGTGGVLTGRDAIEMMMAGATAVGVGSAFWYRGADANQLILAEMIDFMHSQQIIDINDIIGKAVRI